MEIRTLREFAECDPQDVMMYQKIMMAECALNESYGNIAKGFKEYMAGHIRTAKNHMNDAKKYIKNGNKSAAKASLRKAIDEIKRGRSEADKMDDDSLLEQVVIMLVIGLAPCITGCAAAIYAGLGIEMIFGMLYIYTQQKMIMDKSHIDEVQKKIRGKTAAEAYGISYKEHKRITRYALLQAYDNLIKDCETLERQL